MTKYIIWCYCPRMEVGTTMTGAGKYFNYIPNYIKNNTWKTLLYRK